jgi:hypothetical protein
MKLLAPVLACVALAVGAVAHGAATHRWAGPAPESSAAARLHAHAVALGDYEAVEVPSDLPLNEMSVATCRRYTSPSGRPAVVVSVTTGAAGSVATHTPDVCYVASGYKMLRPPARETLDLPGVGQVSYYVTEFEKKSATRTDRQRVRWAWSDDGVWAAPDNPRFAYLAARSLAKVYVVTPVAEPSKLPGAKPEPDAPEVREFVAACLAQYAGEFTGQR